MPVFAVFGNCLSFYRVSKFVKGRFGFVSVLDLYFVWYVYVALSSEFGEVGVEFVALADVVSVELLVLLFLVVDVLVGFTVVVVVVVVVEVVGGGGEGLGIMADPSKLVAPGLNCKILLGLRPVAMSL